MSLPIERNGILRCRGYRRMESEGWSYAYCAGCEELCSIIDVRMFGMNKSFVRIVGFGLTLGSSFDMHLTIYPGMVRFVRHSDGKREAFRVLLQSIWPTRLSLSLGERVVDVLPASDGYAFFSDAREIARLRAASREDVSAMEKLRARFAPGRPSLTPDGDPFFDAELQCPLDPELALAILAFPVLNFARRGAGGPVPGCKIVRSAQLRLPMCPTRECVSPVGMCGGGGVESVRGFIQMGNRGQSAAETIK